MRDSGGDADAVRKSLVPLPRDRPVTRTWSGPLEAAATIRVDMTAEQGEELQVVICREPGLAGPVQSALDELVQYPYGCVEQTMSRFMPAVVAGEAMKKAGLRNPAAERLPEVVAQRPCPPRRISASRRRLGLVEGRREQRLHDGLRAGGTGPLPPPGTAHRRRDAPQGKRLPAGPPQKAAPCAATGRKASATWTSTCMPHMRWPWPLRAVPARNTSRGWTTCGRLARSGEQSSPRLLDRILLAKPGGCWASGAAAAGPAATHGEALPQRATAARSSPRRRCWNWAPLEPNALALAAPGPATGPPRSGNGWGDTLTTSAAVRGLAAVLAAPPAGNRPSPFRSTAAGWASLRPPRGNRIELKLPRVGTVDARSRRSCPRGLLPSPRRGPCRRAAGRPSRCPRDAAHAAVPVAAVAAGSDAGCLRPAGSPAARRTRCEIEVELKQAGFARPVTLPRPCGVELVRPAAARGRGRGDRGPRRRRTLLHRPLGSRPARDRVSDTAPK